MWNALSDLPTWALIALAALAIVASGGGVKAGLDFARWLIERRTKPGDMQAVLRASARINAEILRVREASGADQVLILKAHNGGRIPRIGARLKSTVTHEVWSERRESVMETWQGQPLDAAYIDMLVDVADHGHVSNVTADMPDGVLKTAYEAMGITRSRVVDLTGAQEGVYYYMSLTWTAEATPTDEATIANSCRIARTKVARELERSKATR